MKTKEENNGKKGNIQRTIYNIFNYFSIIVLIVLICLCLAMNYAKIKEVIEYKKNPYVVVYKERIDIVPTELIVSF